METVKNVFGSGTLYESTDLIGNIYATSAACMSVWSDFLSWANANKERMVKSIEEADTIVVLCCQVTDLAVLNDIRVCERLHKQTGKTIYLGGCLAQRFDIPLPHFIKRLDVVRVKNQPLLDKSLVHYEAPFWVKDFKETEEALSLEQGMLFRNFYPLKIGAGCHGKCKYCTIRHTRGEGYATDAKDQIEEFLAFENVVLISDSPTPKQIKDWCEIATRYNKAISFRNLEPYVLVLCEKEVKELAKKGLLKILHCPIQSNDEELLQIMNRSVSATKKAVEIMQDVRKNGTFVATNIIIDYWYNGKLYHNCDEEWLEKNFDYYSWNPYFDGNFDMERAKARFDKYIV